MAAGGPWRGAVRDAALPPGRYRRGCLLPRPVLSPHGPRRPGSQCPSRARVRGVPRPRSMQADRVRRVGPRPRTDTDVADDDLGATWIHSGGSRVQHPVSHPGFLDGRVEVGHRDQIEAAVRERVGNVVLLPPQSVSESGLSRMLPRPVERDGGDVDTQYFATRDRPSRSLQLLHRTRCPARYLEAGSPRVEPAGRWAAHSTIDHVRGRSSPRTMSSPGSDLDTRSVLSRRSPTVPPVSVNRSSATSRSGTTRQQSNHQSTTTAHHAGSSISTTEPPARATSSVRWAAVTGCHSPISISSSTCRPRSKTR